MSEKLISVKEYCEKYGMDGGQARRMLMAGRIEGAFKVGNQWAIPESAGKPEDRRVKSGEYRDWREKYGKKKD